ncbi:TetR/AcrR family transcriptional regulator [Nesterenkonia rhizosphaerae]|uniref:HTH tetR-type domain-containing protein n=1 Tax=Nesterenkonia rhizosphaerae TaxID=1348272 RepID=A0ABP9FXR5_9MICC
MTAVQGRGQARRAAILDAAVSLLFSDGMASVTHRQVAEAAQTPLGSIRYYFSSREDLLLAAVDQLEEARAQAARGAIREAEAELPSRRAAELFVLAFYGPRLSDTCLKGYVGLVMDCARESDRLSLRMREHREVMDAQLRDLLDACGHPQVSVSLATAVVDGSLLNATALRLDGLAGIAVNELEPLLTCSC